MMESYNRADGVALVAVCLMLVTLLVVCIICCCKNRKNNPSSVIGKIFFSVPPTTLLTTRDPEGIIQPDVMFYTRPPTRNQLSPAIVAHALPPLTAKDRLTTPIQPLNPAYQPSQPVTVTTAASGTSGNELTLPPGYVANREVKYR